MNATFQEVPTEVPIAGGQSVEIAPHQPWPSAYRGSRYSLVNTKEYGDETEVTLKWSHRDLEIYLEPPQGIQSAMVLAGKQNARGSFRVTANGEVITKVHADYYTNLEQAPVSEGWIPVYLGRLEGELEMDDVPINPSPPTDGIAVWRGLPFNHGERWSATTDDRLVWRWKDYEFASITDHSELIEAYKQYRSTGGRLYITEYGQVWGNASLTEGPASTLPEIRDTVRTWKNQAQQQGDTASLRLVNRRMTATGDGDPSEGLVPIHLGHLSEFDDGITPTPVVDDETYYAVVGQYEQVWE